MRWLPPCLIAALFLVSLVPTAHAQPDVSLTIEAYDDADECEGDRSYCYEVEEGSVDAIEPGASVEITLVNEGSIEHELVVTPLSAADPDRSDTDESDGIDEIEPIGPGERATETFEIPEDADGVYLWCDIGAHEQLGMWIAHGFAEQDGNGAPGEDGNGAPLAPWIALLALAVAGFRRRP